MRMSDHDHARFAKLLADFVDGCKFERPFHLVVIDGRGSTSVVRYGINGAEQICAGPRRKTALKMLGPLTVTAIAADATCRSALVQIVPARVTVQ
jgi:hypothetical protein